MRTILRRDLTAALKARDRVTVAALRSALAAIENAETPTGADSAPKTAQSEYVAGSAAGVGATEIEPRQLSEAVQRAIIEAEIAERTTAAEEYERLGRNDSAENTRAEAEILRKYLHTSAS